MMIINFIYLGIVHRVSCILGPRVRFYLLERLYPQNLIDRVVGIETERYVGSTLTLCLGLDLWLLWRFDFSCIDLWIFNSFVVIETR